MQKRLEKTEDRGESQKITVALDGMKATRKKVTNTRREGRNKLRQPQDNWIRDYVKYKFPTGWRCPGHLSRSAGLGREADQRADRAAIRVRAL